MMLQRRLQLRPLALIALIAVIDLFGAAACGADHSTVPGSTPPPPSPISITVSPATATLQAGYTQALTATVSGTAETGVTWAVTEGPVGGSVSSSGLYTAPAQAGTFHVVATSVADSTTSATATLTVQALPPPPPAPPPSDAVALGAGLEPIVDWGRTNAFVDLVKQSRGFGTPDTADPSDPVPVDANGWPTTDFGVILWTSLSGVSGLGGTYKLSCLGRADIAPLASDAVVSNVVYTAATNATTADVAVTEGSENFQLSFTGTTGGVQNLKILRPGYTAADTFTTPLKNQLSRFGVIRFMDWENTNNNPVQHWSERSKATDALYSKAIGVPWEIVIQLANELQKDPWINIPVAADDDYLHQLAMLVKAQLDPALHVYLEYSNEVWNGQFIQFQTNLDLATAEVARGGSPLNDDGETDPYVWSWRRVGLRLKQISDAFREVYGDAAITTTVRPVLAGQVVGPYIAKQGLDLIQRTYGPPKNYFYAVAGAPYFDMGPDNDITSTLSVDEVIASLSRGVDDCPRINAFEENAALARWFGMPFVAYEGGPDTFGHNNVASKMAAQFDPRMSGLVQRYLTTWQNYGFGLFNWFVAGATPYNTDFGTWGLTDDMSNINTPKVEGIDATLAAGPQPVTIGAAVPSVADARGYAGAARPFTDPYLTDLGTNDYRDYLVHVAADATYYLEVSVGAADPGSQLGILVNGESIQSVAIAATEGDATFRFLAPVAIHLTPGMNVIRLLVVSPGFNVQSLRLTN